MDMWGRGRRCPLFRWAETALFPEKRAGGVTHLSSPRGYGDEKIVIPRGVWPGEKFAAPVDIFALNG